MESIENIQTILILVYIVILVGSKFIALAIYNEYIDLKKDEKYSSGSWHGGKFFVNPEIVIPIDDKTKNETTQKVIVRHKKAVFFFWIWFAVFIPVLITLNSMS